MDKKLFLLPVAVALSALAQNSDATAPNSALTIDELGNGALPTANIKNSRKFPQTVGKSQELLLPNDGKLFKFVIQRNENKQLLAYHYSHSSHSSHSSHYSSSY